MLLFGGNAYEPPGNGPGVVMDLWRLDPEESNGVSWEKWGGYE